MKKEYIIGVMFILAVIFPILFVPLFALTLLAIFVIAPYVLKHGVWGSKEHGHEL